MAITKLSHVKERKSGNPNAGLYNCIDYILNPDKTEERYIGGNAGSTTQEVYNRMMARISQIGWPTMLSLHY